MNVMLKDIDQRIMNLQKKKRDIQVRQSGQLFKCLEKNIGKSFTPQLAAVVVKEAWGKADQKEREKWIKSAEKFQLTPPRSNRKTALQNSAKD